MVEIIRKIFIRDFKNTADETVRIKYGILAAWIGILTNSLLICLKIGIAIYAAALTNWSTFSLAVISDALNNLSDFLSCCLILFGFKKAGKPADAEHPFGHQRAEYVTSLLVAAFIVAIGVEMGRESISGIISQTTVSYGLIAIVGYVASILIKCFQGYCYWGLGKAIQSQALKNSAWDSLSDILSSAAILVGAVLSKTIGWDFLDPYLGLFVAVLILIGGIKLIKDSVNPLIGTAQNPKIAAKIEQIARCHPETLSIHDVIMHSYGPSELYATLHLEVAANLTLIEAHQIADEIENEIHHKLHVNALVHIDPVQKTAETESITAACEKILHDYDPNLTIHDLQIFPEHGIKRVSLDILLPFADANKKTEIQKKLCKSLTDKYPQYQFEINFDHPF